MVLITRIAGNIVYKRLKPIRGYKLSSTCFSTAQTEPFDQEKQTHFGFEQVTEIEKQQKGKLYEKYYRNILIYTL